MAIVWFCMSERKKNRTFFFLVSDVIEKWVTMTNRTICRNRKMWKFILRRRRINECEMDWISVKSLLFIDSWISSNWMQHRLPFPLKLISFYFDHPNWRMTRTLIYPSNIHFQQYFLRCSFCIINRNRFVFETSLRRRTTNSSYNRSAICRTSC